MKFNAVSNNCVLLDDKFEKNLTNQIIKFEKLCGGNKFNIDSKIKENCDKRVLILLVESLNAIFEKFPNYAVMISRCAPDQFILGIISESDEELFESNKMIPLAYTRDDLSGVYINKSVVNSSLEDIEKQGINAVKSGFHSKLKMNEVVQAGIAHEVGHCFEYCIMRCVNKNEDNIKEDIINKAKDIDPSFNDFVISKYGEANSSEWFAEVFATLMNGQESTVLTQAMGQYLRSYENAILNVSNNN